MRERVLRTTAEVQGPRTGEQFPALTVTVLSNKSPVTSNNRNLLRDDFASETFEQNFAKILCGSLGPQQQSPGGSHLEDSLAGRSKAASLPHLAPRKDWNAGSRGLPT